MPSSEEGVLLVSSHPSKWSWLTFDCFVGYLRPFCLDWGSLESFHYNLGQDSKVKAKVSLPKCLQGLYNSAWVKAFTKSAAYIDENPVHTNEDNDSTGYACSLCLMPLALTRGFIFVWKYSFKSICQIISKHFMQKISTQVVGPRQSQPVSGSLWRNVLSPNLRRGCKTDAKQLTSSSPSSSSASSSPAYKILLHLPK